MAGFAVDIGDAGAAFEQGVTAPSATATDAAANGLAMLGKGIFGVLDDYADSKKTTEASINREAFGKFSDKIQGLKGKTPLQQRSEVSSIIAGYNSQGQDIGEPEAKMIKMMTGIDVEFLNFDPAQEAINSTVEKLQENPAYVYNAEATLRATGKPFTQEDVLRTAMGQVQKAEAATLYLANSKDIAQAEFLQTFVPHANTLLKDTTALAYAALKIETGGGDVRPEQLIGLKANLAQLEAVLAKPTNVSDELYSGIRQQIDLLKGVIDTTMSYDTDVLTAEKADILEPITRALMAQAQEIAKTDPALASVLLSGDAQFLSTYASNKYPALLEKLGSMEVAPTIYTPLELPAEDLAAITSTNSTETQTPTLHNAEDLKVASDSSNVQRNDNIFFATTEQIRLSTPEGMNNPEHRQNFLVGIGKATANIATSGVLIGADTLNEIFNDDVFKKLKIIEKLDPEAAKLARLQLEDAMKAQFSIVSTSSSGSLQSSYFKVTGLGKIEYDIDAFTVEGQTRAGAQTRDLVTALATKYYNGDVTALVVGENGRGSNRKMSTQERSQLEGAGFNLRVAYVDYGKVQKQAKVMAYYVDNLKKLGVDVSALEALAIKPVAEQQTADNQAQQGTRANPFVIKWGDDREANERLLFNIDDNQHFVGPDGRTYRKKPQGAN